MTYEDMVAGKEEISQFMEVADLNMDVEWTTIRNKIINERAAYVKRHNKRLKDITE